jgi:EAL domain-containing protein (putative c-di-GMP-specific phosphodiesterase class I)
VSQAAGIRFLVVEDHGFQRWLIGNLLEGLGAKAVYAASEGRAALEILDKLGDGIDIVVSDLDMPGMDGMQLIRHMAERKHPASLVVVSALEAPLLGTVEMMARDYGVNFLSAIQKPLTARKLQSAIALYRSRAPGDGERTTRAAFTTEEIAEGLRAAQFETFFQPKVEIRSGRTCGAEALARWRHPDKGYVLPGEFIETAESHGLIDALTQGVLGEAVRNCRSWLDLGLDLTVSVNLSPLSLADTSLSERMAAIVDAAGLEPRHVIFEITESATTREIGKKLENLTRLRMKGFGLSIDDYGTGYSSMHRLSQIPFTELKIDKVFVKNAGSDFAAQAMVESSLELAQKLRITTVAEGVESRLEWEMLLARGCELAQGYFIAKPMQAAEFPEWINRKGQSCA